MGDFDAAKKSVVVLGGQPQAAAPANQTGAAVATQTVAAGQTAATGQTQTATPTDPTKWKQPVGAGKARHHKEDHVHLNHAQHKASDLSKSIRQVVGDGTRSMSPGDCVNITSVLSKASPDVLDSLFRSRAPGDSGAPVSTLLSRMSATSPEWSAGLLNKLSTRTDLTPNTKANLLAAISASGDTSRAGQQAIANLFNSTHGMDLVNIKDAIDATGDQTGMMSLVFGSVEDAGIRAQILDHFKTEAKTMPDLPAKALFDVDDTFKQGWVDQSVPKGAVYPGVLAFGNALEQGPKNLQTKPTDLGFLTARPAILEPLTQGTLTKDGVPAHEVLLENSPLRFIGDANIATGKDENYDKYQQLYPERKMVFTGDSGQGDPLTGAHMRGSGTYAGSVFIHDVCVDGKPKTSQADRNTKMQQGLNYFDTYAGAALMAEKGGTISTDSLVKVAQATIDGAKTMKFDNDDQRTRYFGWLQREIGLINDRLKSEGDGRTLSL